jgi:hypothetical protein
MKKSMRDESCLLALDERETGRGQTGLPRESSHREEMEQTGFTPAVLVLEVRTRFCCASFFK